MKMKRIISILSLLATVSCTEELALPAEPEVDNGPTTMLTVSVSQPSFEGYASEAFTWGEDCIGVYGSAQGVNERYLPLESDAEGRTTFYGEAVAGRLQLYFPYAAAGNTTLLAGRLPIPAEQQYYASPYDHLRHNVQMAAATNTTEATFEYHTGIIKLQLMLDATAVEQVRVTVQNNTAGNNDHLAGDIALQGDLEPRVVNGSGSVTLYGIGRQSASEDAPLTLWIAAAEGTYDNLVVTISSAEGSVNKPVRGPFIVERAAATTVEVRETNYNYGIGDFGSKPGEFE